MATLSATIKLQDKMSASINKILESVNQLTSAMQLLNQEVNKFSNANISNIIDSSVVATAQKVQSSVEKLNETVQQTKPISEIVESSAAVTAQEAQSNAEKLNETIQQTKPVSKVIEPSVSAEIQNTQVKIEELYATMEQLDRAAGMDFITAYEAIEQFARAAEQSSRSIGTAAKSARRLTGAAAAAQNAINNFDAGAARLKNTFSTVFSKIKSVIIAVVHPVQTLKNAFSALKTRVSAVKTTIQNFVSVKFNALKSSLSSLKSVLTNSQSGAKGFFNALTNIGKISISGVIGGINKLKSGITGLAGGAIKEAINGIKKLGSITLSTAIANAKKLGSVLKDVALKAKDGAIALTKWSVKGAMTGVGAAAGGVAAIGAAAVKVGKEYESSMSQVAATKLIDKNSEDYKKLDAVAKEMGRTTKFTSAQAAEGLNSLSQAGYKTDEAIAAIPVSLNLASAGNMELGETTSMLANSLNSLNIKPTQDNIEDFADKLALSATLANTDVRQMGEAIKTVGGTAANLKGGNNELDTLLGLYANVGYVGAEGGTHLRNTIMALEEQADAFKKIGINVYDPVTGKLNSMGDTFKALKKHMAGMTDAQKDAFIMDKFKVTDVTAIKGVLNQIDKYDEIYAEIENKSKGAAEKMAKIQNDNLNGDIEILKSGLSGLGTSIFEDMNTSLRGGVQYATQLVDTLNKNYESGGLEGMLSGVGSILAGVLKNASVVIPEFINLGTKLIMSFLKGITANAGKVQSITAQIIGSIANSLRTAVPAFIQTAAMILKSFLNGLTQNAPAILDAAITIISSLIAGYYQAMPALYECAGALVHAIWDKIISTDWVSLAKNVVKEFTDAGTNCIKGFTKGLFGGKENNVTVDVDVNSQSAVEKTNSCLNIIKNQASNEKTVIDLEVNTADANAVGLEMGNNFTKGFDNGLTQTTKSAVSISKDITSTFDNVNLTEQGINIINTLSSGMDSQKSKIGDITKTVSNGIIKTFSSINLTSTGANIMQGLNNGMLSMKGKLLQTASSIASAVNSAMNKALEIHSPSKKTAWTGEMIGQGLIHGLSGTLRDIEKASYNAAEISFIGFSDDEKEYMLSGGNTNINKNTNSPVIKIDMSGMQNIIQNDDDIDTIIEKLEKRLEKAFLINSEGVY